VLFAFGPALGAQAEAQRGADLAAISAAQVMRRSYSRLFEPAAFEDGTPNPRHLSNAEYLALARAAALRGARRNGVSGAAVGFPAGFAPTRVTVALRERATVRLGPRRRDPVDVRARATAEIAPDAQPAGAGGGGYSGPLAYRQGKPNRQLFPAF
jgi:hypothetical protein